MEQNRRNARELLLRAKEESARCCREIEAARPLEREYLYRRLREYVLSRFLLEPDEAGSEELDELARRSLAQSMRISPDLAREFDTARSCSSASSAMVKKVLLLLAIQRDLRVELPAEGSASPRTLRDLADFVWAAMARSPDWRGRMALPKAE